MFGEKFYMLCIVDAWFRLEHDGGDGSHELAQAGQEAIVVDAELSPAMAAATLRRRRP